MTRAPLWTVVADAQIVHGCRRARLVMLVRCPHCTHTHMHSAPLGFSEGKRNAGCHRGRYVVRVGELVGAAA
jgi:hypothetical protein